MQSPCSHSLHRLRTKFHTMGVSTRFHPSWNTKNPQSPWVLCISGPNKVPSKLEHNKPSVTKGFANLAKTHSHHGFCAFHGSTRFRSSRNTSIPHVYCGFCAKKLENISKSKNQKFNMGTPSVRMVQKKFLTWALMDSSRSSCTMLWASWWAHFRQ